MSITTVTPAPWQLVPSTSHEMLQVLNKVQDILVEMPQIALLTEHVIHGGMYARTVRLDPGTVITGSLIKVPTMLICNGSALALVGTEWKEIHGYNVIPASAGRKQLFVATGPLEITAIFPTKATTVEDAEKEFTDEVDLLLSRRKGLDMTTITGE